MLTTIPLAVALILECPAPAGLPINQVVPHHLYGCWLGVFPARSPSVVSGGDHDKDRCNRINEDMGATKGMRSALTRYARVCCLVHSPTLAKLGRSFSENYALL